MQNSCCTITNRNCENQWVRVKSAFNCWLKWCICRIRSGHRFSSAWSLAFTRPTGGSTCCRRWSVARGGSNWGVVRKRVYILWVHRLRRKCICCRVVIWRYRIRVGWVRRYRVIESRVIESRVVKTKIDRLIEPWIIARTVGVVVVITGIRIVSSACSRISRIRIRDVSIVHLTRRGFRTAALTHLFLNYFIRTGFFQILSQPFFQIRQILVFGSIRNQSDSLFYQAAVAQ